MSLSKFRASLSEELRPVYVIIDKARPILDRALQAVRDAVEPRLGLAAFNHGRYRASEANAIEALSAARTLPVMAEWRLVEVLDFQEASRSFVEALLEYLDKPSDTTVLVIGGAKYPQVEKLNPSVRIRKALDAAGLGEPVKLGDPSPVQFVQYYAKTQGKPIDRACADLIVAAVGTDLGQLESEIDKLVTFVGDAAIDQAAIARSSSLTAAAVDWNLATGLAARDVELTLSTLQRLQTEGAEPRHLLGMVGWQMRTLAQARQALLAGMPDGEVIKRFRLRAGVLRRIRPHLLGGFPDSAELMRRIATANRQMNSHRAGADRLLEGLVLEMLTGRLRRPPEVPRPR